MVIRTAWRGADISCAWISSTPLDSASLGPVEFRERAHKTRRAAFYCQALHLDCFYMTQGCFSRRFDPNLLSRQDAAERACEVVLLLSAEMQIIVPRFSTHVGIANEVNQKTTKSTNNRARTKAPTSTGKFDRHVFITIFVMVLFHNTHHMLTTRTFPGHFPWF